LFSIIYFKSNAFSPPGRFPLSHPRLYFCKAQINGKSERHGKSFKVRMGENIKEWIEKTFLSCLQCENFLTLKKHVS